MIFNEFSRNILVFYDGLRDYFKNPGLVRLFKIFIQIIHMCYRNTKKRIFRSIDFPEFVEFY